MISHSVLTLLLFCRYAPGVKNFFATVQIQGGDSTTNLLRGAMTQGSSRADRLSTDAAEPSLCIPSTTALRQVNASRDFDPHFRAGVSIPLIRSLCQEPRTNAPQPTLVFLKVDETDLRPGLVDSIRPENPLLLPSHQLSWSGDHDTGNLLDGPEWQAQYSQFQSLRESITQQCLSLASLGPPCSVLCSQQLPSCRSRSLL